MKKREVRNTSFRKGLALLIAALLVCGIFVSPMTAKAGETYTVTFNGSDLVEDVEVYVNEGDTIPASSIPDYPDTNGFRFTGWYEDSACSVEFDFTTPITEDITIYSGWENLLIEYVPIDLSIPKKGDARDSGSASTYLSYISIDSVSWFDEDGIGAFDTFEAGKTYFCEIHMTLTDAHYFTDDSFAVINGGELSGTLYLMEDGVLLTTSMYTLPDDVPSPGSITLSLTIPVAGTTYGGYGTGKASVTGGEATVSSVGWFDTDDKDSFDKFEEGKGYYAEIFLTPNDGYAFTGSESVTINGETASYWEYSSNPKAGSLFIRTVYYTIEAAPGEKIEKIELELTLPKGGDPYEILQNGTGAKVKEGPVTLYTSGWFIGESGPKFATNEFDEFEGGKKYFATFYLIADEGYAFNGEEKVTIKDEKGKEIELDTIEISDFPDAGSLHVVTVMLTIEEGEGFKVKFDMNGVSADAPKDQTVIKDGKAKEPGEAPTAKGYKFAGWYMDAACTVPFDFNTPITKETTIYARWKAVIDQVEIKIGTPEVGMKASDGSLEPKSKTDGIVVSGFGWTGGSGSMGETDTFESGGSYQLQATLSIEDADAVFAEKTKVYVNGEEATVDVLSDDAVEFSFTFKTAGEPKDSKDSSSKDASSSSSGKEPSSENASRNDSEEEEEETRKDSKPGIGKIAAIAAAVVGGIAIVGIASAAIISSVQKKRRRQRRRNMRR